MNRLELLRRAIASMPNDPERYRKDPTKVLNALKAALATTPSLRVGQLIENARSVSTYKDRDLFYLEDHEFVDMLTQFLTTLKEL